MWPIYTEKSANEFALVTFILTWSSLLSFFNQSDVLSYWNRKELAKISETFGRAAGSFWSIWDTRAFNSGSTAVERTLLDQLGAVVLTCVVLEKGMDPIKRA